MHLWLQNDEVFFEEKTTVIYLPFWSRPYSSGESYRCRPLFCRKTV